VSELGLWLLVVALLRCGVDEQGTIQTPLLLHEITRTERVTGQGSNGRRAAPQPLMLEQLPGAV